MAYRTSQEEEFDQGPPWSDWNWDTSHSAWYAYRTNAEGKQEYFYQQPDRSEATPRTPGRTDGGVTSDEQSTHSSPSSSTNPIVYTTSQSNDYHDLDHGATPKPPASVHDNYRSPDPRVSNYGTASTGHWSSTWSPEHPSSGNSTWQLNTDVASPSIDATASALGDMTLANSPVPHTGTFEGQTQAIASSKRISRAPNTGDAETLDPRYMVYGGFRQQNDFWKTGRVFMMLWTEPAQLKVPANGGTRNGSHFSTTFHGQQAYSEIRRFVVVIKNYGNSVCCPIHTYSGQATLKPNLSAPLRHTIIHTTPQVPEERSYRTSDNQLISENLVLDPIQVNSERSHEPEGSLNPLSRLNYSKVYTVEHYVRVFNIGMVASNSMSTFLDQSGWSQGVQPAETQRPRPNRPHRPSGHSSSNHKNRHSHKHK